MTSRPVRTVLALAVGTALVGAACSSGDDAGGRSGGPAPVATPNLQLAAALEPFDDCDALLGYLKDEAGKRVTAYGLPGSEYAQFDEVGTAINSAEDSGAPAGGAPPTTVTASAPSADASNRSASESSGELPTTGGGEDGQTYSGTNVQEKGIDEPDLVKTDGRRLFTVLDNTLYAFTVDGDAPVQVGSLELDLSGGTAESLLLAGDDILVLGNVYGYDYGPMPTEGVSRYPYGSAGGATLTKVDVTDPTAMVAGATTVVDGATLNARMVDTTARVVIETPPPPFEFVYPSRSGSPKAEQTALEANRKIIEDSTLEDWLPMYVTDAPGEKRSEAQPLLDCAAVSHPKEFAGFGTVTVFTVPLDGEIDPANAVGVLATGDQVYASSEHLYISTTRQPETPLEGATGGTAESAPTETTTEATTEEAPTATTGTDAPGTTVTTQPATTTTVADVPEDDEVRTAIHRFAIPADGPAVYEASGELVGELMAEFSMSEYEGNLRVATTDSWWSGSSRDIPESYVTVLTERDGELVQIGQVGGLGKNEQIRSVRFIDDVGYVVTFRQTDPLYTIDLADPTAPKVAGELKILGYSAYLHPVGEGRLLGVGQDATAQGRRTGVQVSLFDVSDPAAPKELQKVSLPYGNSAVEQDYHAFLWWDPTQLAMIPMEYYGDCIDTFTADGRSIGDCAYEAPFVGAIGYTVTPDGITELAKVAQPAEGTPGVVCPPGAECLTPDMVTAAPSGPATTVVCITGEDCPGPTPVPPPTPTIYPAPILRSIVVDDKVLTLSASGIRASALDTLVPLSWTPIDPT